MDQAVFKRRTALLSILVGIGALVFIVKLVYVQIFNGEKYNQLADRQYITNIAALFNRGSILLKQKDGTLVSVATTRSGFKVTMNPKQIGDPELVYEKLHPWVDITHDRFLELVAHKNSVYQEVALAIDEPTASKITDLKIPGISVVRMNWRWYPAGELAAHVIGFIAFKGDDLVGRYGLEYAYEKTLARTDERFYINFFAEVFSDVKNVLSDSKETEGDLIISIDPLVQQNLESLVRSVQVKWNSKRVGGIIMNPNTGTIYAMALDNGFDLNQTRTVTDVAQFNNPLVEGVFEMGSTMKPIVMALALDQGVVTPTTTYFDQGVVTVGDKTISNFDKRGRGLVNMQTVLSESLNTGMVFVMQKMDKIKFRNGWLSFGFDKKTGIDLPGEAAGLVSNIYTDRDVEFANISFGQGVAVTPIAMVRAFAALANGGNLVTPHVVSEIQYLSGLTKKIEYPVQPGIITQATSKTITEMLVQVFDHYGQGKYKMDHYAIATKTGTAQIADSLGGYFADHNLHSFAAYFPAYHPEFVIFLYNDYPKNGATFSSETLLPPFIDLAKFLINYYNLPPDR